MTEPQNRRRFLLATVAVAAVLLLGVGGVWFFWPPKVIDRPVALARGADGKLEPAGADGKDGGVQFEAHAGTLRANNSLSTSSSSAHSTPDYFFSRSLTFINLSDHPLMDRVGEELLTLLKQENQFERLEYYPYGHLPEVGSAAPHLMLTIGLESIEDSGGLVGRKLKAKLRATLGTSLAKSNHGYSDSLSPPAVRYSADMHLDHDSTMTGVESAGARYLLQARDIAKQFANAVADQVTKGREENSLPQAPLPDAFYPEWREAPQFAFLEALGAKRLTGFHGLMFHNESFWVVPGVTEPRDVLFQVKSELEGEGWKGGEPQVNLPLSVNMRMTDGPKVVEVFHVSRHMDGKNEGGPVDLFVRYRDRMAEADHHAAYGELLANGSLPLEQMLELRQYASGEQQRQIIETLKADPPATTRAWLALAAHYAHHKDVEAARHALIRVQHLGTALGDRSHEDSQIKSLAKKLQIDEKELEVWDAEIFEELGFVRWSGQAGPQTVEVNLGEPVRFYAPGEEGEFEVLAVTMENSPPGGKSGNKLTILSGGTKGSRHWSTSRGGSAFRNHEHQATLGEHELRVKIERTADDRVRVTASAQSSAEGDSETAR